VCCCYSETHRFTGYQLYSDGSQNTNSGDIQRRASEHQEEPSGFNHRRMITITTTTNDTEPQPEFYILCGHCPQCGAPLYHDGKMDCTVHGYPKALPKPYYTCDCRLRLAPQYQYVPYPIYPTPPPPYPTYPQPDPQPTWNPDPTPYRWWTVTTGTPYNTTAPVILNNK
jgi:hypothetical protein